MESYSDICDWFLDGGNGQVAKQVIYLWTCIHAYVKPHTIHGFLLGYLWVGFLIVDLDELSNKSVTYIHAYMHIYGFFIVDLDRLPNKWVTYVHAYMHTHTYRHIYTRSHTHTHAHIHTRRHLSQYGTSRSWRCGRWHCIHTHTYMNTYIYTCTHAGIFSTLNEP